MTADAIGAPETARVSPTDRSQGGPGGGKTPGPRARRPLRAILYGVLSVIGVLAAALIVFLWLANWNMLRGPIGRFASARAHRRIELLGDLRVHLLTFTPTVSIGDLRIGEPSWAGPGDVADIGRIVVSVKFWPLLIGRVVMPLVEIDRPNLDLLRDAQGRENWVTGPANPKAKPFKLPPIQRFIVQDGRLKFVDAVRRLTLNGRIDSNERAGGAQSHAFSLSGEGAVNREPFNLNLAGGPLLNIKLDQPYPFTADVRAGRTHIVANGRLDRPFDLARFSTSLSLTGADLADVYYLTGIALPNTPPYAIKGVLSRDNQTFTFDRAEGRVGGSDLEGRLKVTLSSSGRPDVNADLRSRVLDFKDLAALFGASPAGSTLKPSTPRPPGKGGSAASMKGQGVLPDATLATDRLRSMDATVVYQAQSVKTQFAPISGASLALTLDHGLLSVHPVSFRFPEGRLMADVSLDARAATPVTTADVRLSNVDLQEFAGKAEGGPPPIEGALAGRLKLTGRGDSVHKAAASANGDVTVVIPGGKVRRAFAELLGVNAGKGLSLLLSKNKGETNIRCAVADFAVRDGVMRAEDVVFDTDVVKVVGSGAVNLGPETLDLTLKGESKRFSFTHLLLPITIQGTLGAPAIGVQPAATVAQGAAAVALGAVFTPFAAILPFVDPGLAKNADCAAIINQAHSGPASISVAQTSQTSVRSGAMKRAGHLPSSSSRGRASP